MGGRGQGHASQQHRCRRREGGGTLKCALRNPELTLYGWLVDLEHKSKPAFRARPRDAPALHLHYASASPLTSPRRPRVMSDVHCSASIHAGCAIYRASACLWTHTHTHTQIRQAKPAAATRSSLNSQAAYYVQYSQVLLVQRGPGTGTRLQQQSKATQRGRAQGQARSTHMHDMMLPWCPGRFLITLHDTDKRIEQVWRVPTFVSVENPPAKQSNSGAAKPTTPVIKLLESPPSRGQYRRIIH